MPKMDKNTDKSSQKDREKQQQTYTTGQQNVLPGDKAGVRIENLPTGSNQ